MQDNRFRNSVLAIFAILVVLLLPFVAIGSWLEPEIEKLVESEWLGKHVFYAALIGIALLVADIVLPVPNSVVCTMMGSLWGPFAGSLICWTGLTLSALAGFFLARTGARRFGRREMAPGWDHKSLRRSGFVLAICRPLPLLSESSVVAAGVFQMPWSAFLPPVVLSNLVISVAWATFGWWARDQSILFQALLVSALIPVAALATWLVLRPTTEKRGGKQMRPDSDSANDA
jgi:uncharacterized membrane protein YdjX (TVP38/TMEM64 family)